MKKILVPGVCIIALVVIAAWAPNAVAYELYRNEFGDASCSQCHPGFIGGPSGALHSAHTGYTVGCTPCHVSPGSTPVNTNFSGTPGGLGCSGCHQGGGLQLHHTNAGAPPDGNDLTCAICHPGATSPPENTPPAYYADTAITTIEDSCQSTPAPPGEDFGGGGLDNDGNLLYNENDPACVAGCTVDADCDDGVFCNGAETCDTASGECLAGTPPSCDDGVTCTDDACDATLDDCVNTPNDGNCDDNDVCNGIETCDLVNDCQAGTPLDCDDGDLCTTDSCDPLTGCANLPVECAPGEQCDPGTGQCVVPPECTVDADCDDGLFCNGSETCDTATGSCQPGMPPDCDDGVFCTLDTCDEVNDACVNTPDDVSCDDGDICNGIETCDPNNDCQPGTPLVCDDGNLCTTDSCDPLTGCAFTPIECPPGEQCDPVDGTCKAPPGCTADADCDDGMFCNGAETCDTATGTCQPGTPPDCDDGIACTVDTCDEVNDACVNTPDDTACPDDGLFCTGQEICDPAAGCVSTGDPCPEGTTCNEDTESCDVVSKKVTLCHKGKKTITVGAPAVRAHLRHGDTLGPCP